MYVNTGLDCGVSQHENVQSMCCRHGSLTLSESQSPFDGRQMSDKLTEFYSLVACAYCLDAHKHVFLSSVVTVATVPERLPAPLLSRNGANTLSVSWALTEANETFDAGGDNITAFSIYIFNNSAVTNPYEANIVVNVTDESLRYVDIPNLENGVPYTAAVSAWNKAGESLLSPLSDGLEPGICKTGFGHCSI